MDHKELCQKVLELIPQVRFSGILNSRGDLAVASNRDDSGKLLSEEEVKMWTWQLQVIEMILENC
jgi:hypothetical protein